MLNVVALSLLLARGSMVSMSFHNSEKKCVFYSIPTKNATRLVDRCLWVTDYRQYLQPILEGSLFINIDIYTKPSECFLPV